MEGIKMTKTVLLTTKEVAVFLGVSLSTLARYRVNGTGPKFVKFGDEKQCTIRYREKDVETYINESLRASTWSASHNGNS